MAVTADSPERVLAADGKSLTPSSASNETNFRELDDAFLQTQTRIWLGEVLQIRFSEEISIGDLLEDGELLFELSEVISRMLPAEDESHLKLNEWKSVASSKSTRRYMPYSNVGSFLKMCKTVGMDGIDLFTPSDVVEKRNTRKVCMCMRSLSKKVRSRNLIVPDFDSVTRTLVMPTDKVEGIRKSLEYSHSTSSLSTGIESGKVPRVRRWQGMSNSTSAASNDDSADNGDEAESSFLASLCDESSDFACETDSPAKHGPQLAKEDKPALNLQLNGDSENEHLQCEFLSPSVSESVGSACSEYYSDQEVSSIQSSTCVGSRVNGETLGENSTPKHGSQSGDFSHVPIAWGDSDLYSGSIGDNAAQTETFCVSCDEVDAHTAQYDTIITRENDLSNIFREMAHPPESECEKRLSDNIGLATDVDSIHFGARDLVLPHECVEDNDYCREDQMSKLENFEGELVLEEKEMVPCGGPGGGKSYSHDICVVDDVLCCDETLLPKFGELEDGQVAAINETAVTGQSYGETSVGNNLTDELQLHGSCSLSSPTTNPSSSPYTDEIGASETSTEVMLAGENPCDDKIIIVNRDTEDLARQLKTHVELICCSETSHEYKEASRDHTLLDQNIGGKTSKIRDSREGYQEDDITDSVNHHFGDVEDVKFVQSFSSNTCDPHQGGEIPEKLEEIDHYDKQCSETTEKDGGNPSNEDNHSKEIAVHKPQRKLLKSVVKGTAVVGVAIVLFHLRKNNGLSLSKLQKKSTDFLFQKTSKPPPRKGPKNGNTSSVYPAGKLLA